MTLPPRIAKPAKRASRWRSPAHCAFVRSHACSWCGSTAAIEVAHLRMGSGAGFGQKPDDFRSTSLCRECHARQHAIGEPAFWQGRDVEALVAAFIAASPKASEIRQIMRERANG